MKINVLPNQIAIVSKKNGLQKLLMDGTHHVFCSNVKLLNRKNSLESVNLDATILTSGNVKEKFTSFEVKNNEIGFHYIDGIFSDYLSAGKYTFAKEPYEHKLIIKNMSNVKIGDDIEISILRNAITSQPNNILNATIVEGYTGALYIDGALKELLPPGEYYFFQGVKKVFVKPISLKKQTLTINGQRNIK